MDVSKERRLFLSTGIAGVGVVLVANSARSAEPSVQPPPAKAAPKPADINATEDLMREHGVLRRVLLIYRESVRRISSGSPPSADVLTTAAGIIRNFIEGYHERLEEEEVFPRMEKAGILVELVHVLKLQHQAGRRLTATILATANTKALKSAALGATLTASIDQFVRMYEPHAAREDTDLFPAFHSLFTEKEFDELGDRFEEKEHQLLGNSSFEGTLEQVRQLERALGIYELAQFTPK
jgi:hemerythrin-like domain-containing protein